MLASRWRRTVSSISLDNAPRNAWTTQGHGTQVSGAGANTPSTCPEKGRRGRRRGSGSGDFNYSVGLPWGGIPASGARGAAGFHVCGSRVRNSLPFVQPRTANEHKRTNSRRDSTMSSVAEQGDDDKNTTKGMITNKRIMQHFFAGR